MLKKVLIFISFALFLVSCDESRLIFNNHFYGEFPDITDKGNSPSSPPDENPSSPVDTIPVVEPQRFYFVTIEYPKGYDWMEDARRGEVKDVYLVVYQDFEELRRIEVSQAAQVSSQQDFVFLHEGDLYTVFPEDEQTIVKCNGEYLFTIPARENVSSLVVDQGNVYTLGYSTKKRDVSYRKNGESVIYVSDASVVNQLYFDGGNVCFSYVVYSSTVKYYYCINDMSFLLSSNPDYFVYAVQTYNGQPLYIYRTDDLTVWYNSPRNGENYVNMAMDEDGYKYDYKLFVDRYWGISPVEFYHSSVLHEDITVLDCVDGSFCDVVYGLSSVYLQGGNFIVVYYREDEGYSVTSLGISGDKITTRIPQRFNYSPHNRGSVEFSGEVYAAFSTKTVDGESIIQMGRNRYKSFRFNGYILAVEVGN